MFPKDKEIMDMHLNAIREAIHSLNDKEDRAFVSRLNFNLIDLREKIRKHAAGENDGKD